MPRFHLHLKNGLATDGDLEGQEFADADAAIREAALAAAEVVSDELAATSPVVNVEVTVEDDVGMMVAAVIVRASIERP